MFIEFILIWMLGKAAGMDIFFWILFAVLVAYRIIKEMADNAPEMEDE